MRGYAGARVRGCAGARTNRQQRASGRKLTKCLEGDALRGAAEERVGVARLLVVAAAFLQDLVADLHLDLGQGSYTEVLRQVIQLFGSRSYAEKLGCFKMGQMYYNATSPPNLCCGVVPKWTPRGVCESKTGHDTLPCKDSASCTVSGGIWNPNKQPIPFAYELAPQLNNTWPAAAQAI